MGEGAKVEVEGGRGKEDQREKKRVDNMDCVAAVHIGYLAFLIILNLTYK